MTSVVQHQDLVVAQATDNTNISLADFKSLVDRWLEYERGIKAKRDEMKVLRADKDELTDVIKDFMIAHNVEDINTSHGKIRCKTKTTKAPINQKVVMNKIAEFFKHDELNRDELLARIYTQRAESQVTVLRRIG